jgi:hypothetical protein
MKTDFTVFLLKKGFARYEPQSLQVAVQNIATAEYEKVRQPFFYTYLKKGEAVLGKLLFILHSLSLSLS